MATYNGSLVPATSTPPKLAHHSTLQWHPGATGSHARVEINFRGIRIGLMDGDGLSPKDWSTFLQWTDVSLEKTWLTCNPSRLNAITSVPMPLQSGPNSQLLPAHQRHLRQEDSSEAHLEILNGWGWQIENIIQVSMHRSQSVVTFFLFNFMKIIVFQNHNSQDNLTNTNGSVSSASPLRLSTCFFNTGHFIWGLFKNGRFRIRLNERPSTTLFIFCTWHSLAWTNGTCLR